MALNDIRSIKNVGSSPVSINGNNIAVGQEVYVFYKPEFFANNAGDLQQYITQGEVLCTSCAGLELSIDDALQASSRASNFLYEMMLLEKEQLTSVVSSNVVLGPYEQLVSVETSSGNVVVELPLSPGYGRAIDIQNSGSGVAVIVPGSGQLIGGKPNFSIQGYGYTRFVADLQGWGVLASMGATGALGLTGVQGTKGATGVDAGLS